MLGWTSSQAGPLLPEEEDEDEKDEEKKEMSATMVWSPLSPTAEKLLALRIRLRLHCSPDAKPDLVARRIIASLTVPARAPRRP